MSLPRAAAAKMPMIRHAVSATNTRLRFMLFPLWSRFLDRRHNEGSERFVLVLQYAPSV